MLKAAVDASGERDLPLEFDRARGYGKNPKKETGPGAQKNLKEGSGGQSP